MVQAVLELAYFREVDGVLLLLCEQPIGIEKKGGDPAEKASDQHRPGDDPALGQRLPLAQPSAQEKCEQPEAEEDIERSDGEQHIVGCVGRRLKGAVNE